MDVVIAACCSIVSGLGAQSDKVLCPLVRIFVGGDARELVSDGTQIVHKYVFKYDFSLSESPLHQRDPVSPIFPQYKCLSKWSFVAKEDIIVMLQKRQMTCFLLFVESFSPKENAIWRNCSHVVGGASNGNFGLRVFFSAPSSSVEADLGHFHFHNSTDLLHLEK